MSTLWLSKRNQQTNIQLQRVCRQAFLTLCGISNNKLNNLWKGRIPTIYNTAKKAKKENTLCWLRNHFEEVYSFVDARHLLKHLSSMGINILKRMKSICRLDGN